MKFNMLNKNGDLMCAAFQCRKHARLRYVEKQWFCEHHADEIICIRNSIREVKGKRKLDPKNTALLKEEIQFRRQELWFRQHYDAGHYYFLLKLVRLLL